MVLIHGMAASMRTWDYQIPALLEAGYRVYAFDLLGHGDSAKPSDPAYYHIDEIYTHAAEWLLELGQQQPLTLIGHSLGSYVGLNFTHQYPDLVERMVMFNPFYSQRQLSPVIQWASGRTAKLSAKFLEMAPMWAIDPFVRYNRNIANNLENEAIVQMALDYKRVDPRIMYTAPTVGDLLPRATELQHPTLAIWGDKDLTLTPRFYPELVDAMPQAEGHSVSGAGHTPHLTNYGEVNPRMLDFLNQAI